MPISATNIAGMACNATKSVNKIQKYSHSQNLRSLEPKLAVLAFLGYFCPKMPISATNIAGMACNATKSGHKIQKYPHSQNLRTLGPKLSFLAIFDQKCQFQPQILLEW